MKKILTVLMISLGIGGAYRSGVLADNKQSNMEEFSNLFMEKDGEQPITDWNMYKADRYKQIAAHLQDKPFRYLWLESNPMAFVGIPFVIYRAMEEMYGKKPGDLLSTESLKSAGVRGWRQQDQELITQYYGGKSVSLFYFSRKFNFPVGLHESRILPGEPVAGNSDCLLYTSPSPRDRTRSRMPSSA